MYIELSHASRTAKTLVPEDLSAILARKRQGMCRLGSIALCSMCAIDLAGNGAGRQSKLLGNAAQAEVVVL